MGLGSCGFSEFVGLRGYNRDGIDIAGLIRNRLAA